MAIVSAKFLQHPFIVVVVIVVWRRCVCVCFFFFLYLQVRRNIPGPSKGGDCKRIATRAIWQVEKGRVESIIEGVVRVHSKYNTPLVSVLAKRKQANIVHGHNQGRCGGAVKGLRTRT